MVTKIIDVNKIPEEKKKCIICMDFFSNNDNTIYLPCIHLFHEDCIKEWCKRNPICPLCKCDINNISN